MTSITVPFVGASRTATGPSGAFGYIFGHSTERSSSDYQSSSSEAFVDKYVSSSSHAWYSCYDYYNSYYYSYLRTYYYNVPSSLKTVTITDATAVPDAAFNNCKNITDIKLNAGITSIGGYAFRNNTSLKDFVIPDTVSTIGSYAFLNCSNLSSITLPEKLTIKPVDKIGEV